MQSDQKLVIGGETESIIREIYELAGRLEAIYPGRHFTPDGRMVGSLGEAIASERYGIELYEASHPVHDAFGPDRTTLALPLVSAASIVETQSKTIEGDRRRARGV